MSAYQDLKDRHEYLRARAHENSSEDSDEEKIPCELDGFDEAMEWIQSFSEKLENTDVVSVAHSLVQLGVEDPHYRKDSHTDDWLYFTERWFGEYQWQFNTAAWELITSHNGMIQKLRRVLQADLRAKGEFPNCGKIVMHAYSRALLDYFLKPHGAAWCITPNWQTPEVIQLAETISEADDKISA